MIARFLFEGRLGRFSFDYLGPPWAFLALVLLLVAGLLWLLSWLNAPK